MEMASFIALLFAKNMALLHSVPDGRKKGQTLNPLCKLIACPKQEKRPFLESA